MQKKTSLFYERLEEEDYPGTLLPIKLGSFLHNLKNTIARSMFLF